jgi:NADPH:quinone reductase
MRAFEVATAGAPADLAPVDVATPQAGPGQVEIDVAYCGYNFADTLGVTGAPGYASSWPFRPGLEVSGRVRAVGPQVEHLSIGQRVAALLPGAGGYAEVAVAEASLTVPVPHGVELTTAAGVPLTVSTAILLLEVGRLRAGQTLLMQSASGALAGVVAAVAGRLGAARLVGVVGRQDSVAAALAAGYDHVMVRTPGWSEQVLAANGGVGFDVAFDPVGGETFEASLAALGVGGTLVSCGNASGSADPTIGSALLRKQLVSVAGFSILGFARQRPIDVRVRIAQGLEWLSAGSLELPCVVQQLSAVAAVHDVAMAHASTGKVVFDVSA